MNWKITNENTLEGSIIANRSRINLARLLLSKFNCSKSSERFVKITVSPKTNFCKFSTIEGENLLLLEKDFKPDMFSLRELVLDLFFSSSTERIMDLMINSKKKDENCQESFDVESPSHHILINCSWIGM